jgi:hypothetical protein
VKGNKEMGILVTVVVILVCAVVILKLLDRL